MVVSQVVKRYKAFVMVIALFALWVVYYADQKGVDLRNVFESPETVVRIGNVPLTVRVADTEELRTIGLSNTSELKTTEGMLFVFPEDGYHGIWMKDMEFGIDIIWVSAAYRVVGVTKNVLPESYPRIYEPPEPVRYIIETDAYFVDSFSIKVGDSVEIPREYRWDREG